MAKVKNLVIKLQTGSDNTYVASWEFDAAAPATTPSSGGSIKTGSLVSIKSGATYYNGASIPSWVMSQNWYVYSVSGDRAVINENESGTNAIMSAINTSNLTVVGGGSSSGSSSDSSSSSESGSETTLDHYEVKWYYDTGDDIWYSGNTSSTTSATDGSSASEDLTEKYSTYSAPSNALKLKVSVKPVSKTYKVNDEDTYYWTGTWVSATYETEADAPEQLSAPTVTIDGYQLTASYENITNSIETSSDPQEVAGVIDEVEFQIYNANYSTSTPTNSGIVTVELCRASFSCTVTAGGDYLVRARAIHLYGSTRVYGKWSEFSSSVKTVPSAPSGITTCRASSETSVYLEWDAVNTATSYDLEYATKITYFDGSDQTTTVNNIEFNHYEKTGLESGQEYFFRVRAVNDQGESGWSDIVSVVIGTEPSAPTTWSSSTTVITGEELILYWVHNSEDGSKQKYAEVEIYVDGGEKSTYTISSSSDDDEEESTYSYQVDTSPYTEGTTIQWRVRTAGVTLAYGDWSIQRMVKIYAPPTLELSVTKADGTIIDTLTSFPFYIKALASPSTQAPIGYHVSIVADEVYEGTDNVGNAVTVNKGDAVYSKYFDINSSLALEMTPSALDLENSIEYTVTCTVSLDSGLTADATSRFVVAWVDELYETDMEIALDADTLATYVRPYCRDQDGNTIENVKLAVYRREFDGSFTEIGSGLDNTKNTIVTDPHPSLDYARYRIVAISNSTGAVSYYDAPGYPVKGKAVVIQWNEDWTNFDTTNSDALQQPPWSGSMLKLPYNIDVSDDSNPDVELVEYIGRSHPISYYGTQIGHTSNWSVEVPRTDKETLYSLRRLQRWMGDVYVREPSGSGYWANIKVSFSQKHKTLVIPVTLSITRVEGGA